MKLNKIILPLSLAFAFSVPTAAIAADGEDMQEQLNVLKDEIVILQDQLEETNVSNANRMNISGYADIEYHNSSEDGAEPGFRLHHMSLFFEKRLTDEWKFFSEIEYEDAPFFEHEIDNVSTETGHLDTLCEGCYGKIFLEAANFTYSWEPSASFRGGRFFTPAGLWSVDHYPPFVPTQLRPEHIRAIFPQVVDGLTVFGTVPMGAMFMNYDVYAGNGEGNSGKEDLNSDKATGAKVSFLLPYMRYFEVGASYYSDTLNDDTEKEAIGAHLKMSLAGFTLQSEYATATFDEVGGASYDREGYYVQLLYDISKWTVGGRYDYYDADDSDDLDTTVNSVFVNYHVNPAIILKLEHHEVEDGAEDYSHTIGSVVLYLGN